MGLFIADTISFTTAYSLCAKALCTRQKYGKFCWHDCKTSHKPTKNWPAQLLLWQLPKMMFPRLRYTAEHTHFLRWKYWHGTMSTIAPPSNFNDSTMNTHAHTSTCTYTHQSTARETRTSLKTSTFSCNIPSGPQKLEHPIITQVCDLCNQPWMVSCCTVHSDDKPVLSGNQWTYTDTMS